MKYDEQACAATVRSALAGKGEVREVRMFGGLGFMLNGNLAVTVSRRGMLVRVGAEGEDEALRQTGARPMAMRGRTMTGYVYVDPPGLDSKSIGKWVERALKHVLTLAVGTSKRKQR